MELEAGRIFAVRYKIIEPIGEGGMGRVYRAFHLGLRKQVALKVFGSKDPRVAERFAREAHTLARLDHRGCARILDYGHTQHGQFIAMDLVEGRDLGAVLREGGALSIARATRIARDLLAALAHAHEHGVLHRDLKPANVMIADDDGRVVIIDFGLARVCDDAALTATGTCFGSPSYLAPERLTGGDYDERADLYSVGVVLYELLTGERPYQGATAWEILRRSVDRPPRPLRALRPDVSRALEAVVVRAMARDPARRYGDAAEMLGALDDVPVLEALATATATARDDAASTMIALVRPPSFAQRVWAWLRYGTWRWT